MMDWSSDVAAAAAVAAATVESYPYLRSKGQIARSKSKRNESSASSSSSSSSSAPPSTYTVIDDRPPDAECTHASTTDDDWRKYRDGEDAADELVCDTCGMILDSRISFGEESEFIKKKEGERRAYTSGAGSDKMCRIIAKSLKRSDNDEARDSLKRVRHDMNHTKKETIRLEKKQRIMLRDGLTSAFVETNIKLLMSIYSFIIEPNRASIESTLITIHRSGIVTQCPIVAAYILHNTIPMPLQLDDIIATIPGLTEIAHDLIVSRLKGIATAISNMDKLDTPLIKPDASSAASSSSSSSSSSLQYSSARVATSRMHAQKTVKQIKLHIKAICLSLNESFSTQEYTDNNADQLIDAVSVGTRNLEAIAGAVLYLLIGLCPTAFNVRSYKRIEMTAVAVYEMNNEMNEDRRRVLNEQMRKPKPELSESLLANKAALFMEFAVSLELGIVGNAASDQALLDAMDWDKSNEWDEMNTKVNEITARMQKRDAYVNRMIYIYKPNGVPAASDISWGIQSPEAPLRVLAMGLLKANLIGDVQTLWPDPVEAQQLRGHTTAQTMRATAVEIKQSMTDAMKAKMRPIQSCGSEYVNDEAKQERLWAHIEDLALHYTKRLFTSPFGATMNASWQDVVVKRLKQQVEKARIKCGILLFSHEHESIAAMLLAYCMNTWRNGMGAISASKLYTDEYDVCGLDVSPSSISQCYKILVECDGVL